MIYIVAGVSGSGKTLIGRKLADRLNIPFYDADDFHPAGNVEKMKKGQPLNDEDRLPWLQELKRNIIQWEQNMGAVLACSALKKAYRKILSPPKAEVKFIFLNGPRQLIIQRMKNRTGHFMPDALLDTQFEALEPPANAISVDINQTPEEIIQYICNQLSR